MTRKEHMSAILATELATRASPMLLSRLQQRIGDSTDDPGELRKAVEKIRLAVKMFVDEELAESLARRLNEWH